MLIVLPGFLAFSNDWNQIVKKVPASLSTIMELFVPRIEDAQVHKMLVAMGALLSRFIHFPVDKIQGNFLKAFSRIIYELNSWYNAVA